jgi:hypothetical protein
LLYTQENLKRVLDSIASKPNLARAMRLLGASESTIFRWLKRSAASDPDFLVSWPEGEPPRQFVELVALARRYWSVKWEAQLRDELSSGIPRTVIHDGQIQYVEMDPIKHRDLVALGIWDADDIWERDSKGNRIPLVVHDAAPAHLKIRGADHLLGWSETKRLDVSQRISGGVLVIKRPNNGDEGENESELVRDLRRRLADLEANGPKHSHPETKPVPVGHPSDEPRTDPLPPAHGARPNVSNKTLPPAPYVRADDRAEGMGSAPLSAEAMALKGGFQVSGDQPTRRPGVLGRDGYPRRG